MERSVTSYTTTGMKVFDNVVSRHQGDVEAVNLR